MRRAPFVALSMLVACAQSAAADGNRLTYLDSSDPYYVGLRFPKLTTPMWVGEEGVEAVVVLAIDDMRDNTAKYEAYLRPILNRLRQIDGRAALSIMTCRVDPADAQVQAWLQEGVNLDVHTTAHPCPLLRNDDFAAAQKTVFDCIDILHKVPGNRPVAFRMPCCDSLNTPSPRFYAEIFNQTTPAGHFMSIDSSVFNILTPDDPALPRELVLDPDGRERFRKYLPFKSFVNTIENYPYPYVIGKQCWEFPCVVPSDWEAQNLHKPYNPKTVEDLKAALDTIVLKQGVFNLVFHPHGWIRKEQVVELIDHAVAKHGKKVKFLNFAEALERLNKNLLSGQPLRVEEGVRFEDLDANGDGLLSATEELARVVLDDLDPAAIRLKGADNGARLVDVNNDGYLDVIIANATRRETRIYEPNAARWRTTSFPTAFVSPAPEHPPLPLLTSGVRFGILRKDGFASVIHRDGQHAGSWSFDGQQWTADPTLLQGLELLGEPINTSHGGVDRGVRLRDLDGDGRCELLVANRQDNSVFAWKERQGWTALPFALPDHSRLVDVERKLPDGDPFEVDGVDTGLRFVDLDEDGFDDLIAADDRSFAIWLFESMTAGWTRRVSQGKAEDGDALPPIVRFDRQATDATNNGFWVHSRTLWWQNEHTARLPDLVDRRSFNDQLKNVEPRGKSAEASRESIRVRPGFRIETVAQEPLVADPIAFDWSADGKLWVVEMGDYPMGTDGKGKPGGVVRVLEDTNGDGRYDKATTFLDNLPFPTGILPWRNGVLIAAAPNILYAEDRNGDGKADHSQILFTGFTPGNQQHRLNGFELGLDGWVYGANGDSGGRVKSVKTGEITSIQGRDFRFNPDTGAFEAESGQTQFGRHRDDWGHWFGNNNPNWAWHFVLSDHDLKRNPDVAAPDPKQMLEPERKLYPISRTLARFNDFDNVNRVTSANSPTPYRDDLFGPAFASSLFVSEPVHNLVHRLVLRPNGATFEGERFVDETEREFLASSDNWFRPTMLKTGPDGALWVADMYRAVIEHPQWIPDDWEAKLDLRAGHDQGRIYRVYPVDKAPRVIPRLDRLDTAGLVAALDSPSGWQRDTAMRLLLHARETKAIEPLQKLLRGTKRPQTRVQALWTLSNLGGLDAGSAIAGLRDTHPEVRRNAVRVAIALAGQNAEVAHALLARTNDPEAAVRFELALVLGDWNDPRAGKALAQVVQRDPEDRWLRAAVLSSAQPHLEVLLQELFAAANTAPPPAAYVEPLFRMAATRPERLARLVRSVSQAEEDSYHPWQFVAASGLLDAIERRNPPRTDGRPTRLDAATQDLFEQLKPLFQAARKLADDGRAPIDGRVVAVRVLGREWSQAGIDLDRLANLLKPQTPGELQLAAVATLGKLRDPRVPTLFVSNWKERTPQVRSAILDLLINRPAWTPALLAAAEQRRIVPSEIDPARRRRLLLHPNTALRKRAAELFADEMGSRQSVVTAYRPAIARLGDAAAGAATF